jgi:hypothetical protein
MSQSTTASINRTHNKQRRRRRGRVGDSPSCNKQVTRHTLADRQEEAQHKQVASKMAKIRKCQKKPPLHITAQPSFGSKPAPTTPYTCGQVHCSTRGQTNHPPPLAYLPTVVVTFAAWAQTQRASVCDAAAGKVEGAAAAL